MMFKSLKQSSESNQLTKLNNVSTPNPTHSVSKPTSSTVRIIEAQKVLPAPGRYSLQLALLSIALCTLPGHASACEQGAITTHTDTQHTTPSQQLADTAVQNSSAPKAVEDMNAFSDSMNVGRSDQPIALHSEELPEAVVEEEVATRGDAVNLTYFFTAIGAWFQGLISSPASTSALSTEVYAGNDVTTLPASQITDTPDVTTEVVTIAAVDQATEADREGDDTAAAVTVTDDAPKTLAVEPAAAPAATPLAATVSAVVVADNETVDLARDESNVTETSENNDLDNDSISQEGSVAEATAPESTQKATPIGKWLSTLLVASSATNDVNTETTDTSDTIDTIDTTDISASTESIATAEDINNLNNSNPTAAGIEKPSSREGKRAMNAKMTPEIVDDLPSKEPVIPIKDNTSNALSLTWALEKNWDSAHPGECRLTTSTIQLDDHGYATQVWFDVIDDKLQINTSAYIDTGMPGVGIRDTQGNLSKFEHSDYISKAIWQGNLQKTIVKSRIVKLVIGGVEIGSQPQEVLLDLSDLSKSYPAYRQCNRG